MRSIFAKIFVAALAGTLAVAFSACSSPPSVNTYEDAESGTVKHVVRDKRIITDRGTEACAYVTELRTGTTPDGQLSVVQAELVNCTDYIARLVYTVEWFDAQGLKIETPSTWIPCSVLPGKHESLSFVAPTPAAKDFRISIMRTE